MKRLLTLVCALAAFALMLVAPARAESYNALYIVPSPNGTYLTDSHVPIPWQWPATSPTCYGWVNIYRGVYSAGHWTFPNSAVRTFRVGSTTDACSELDDSYSGGAQTFLVIWSQSQLETGAGTYYSAPFAAYCTSNGTNWYGDIADLEPNGDFKWYAWRMEYQYTRPDEMGIWREGGGTGSPPAASTFTF